MYKFLFVTLFTLINYCAMTQSRVEMGRYAKNYTNKEGAIITIVRYGAGENNEVLVKVQGVDHSFDGVIFKAKANTGTGSSRDYTTSYKGKNYTLLTWKDGAYTLLLAKENISEPVQQSLSFVDVYSAETPERLQTAYLEQAK